MRLKTSLLILTALALCSCVNSVSQQDLQAVYSRINHNEQQIRTLNSQVGVEGSVVPGQAQMWTQMQSLQQDVNAVRGQVEDLTMRSNGPDPNRLEARIDQLEANMRRMAAELAIDLDAYAPASADSGMQQNPDVQAASPAPQETSVRQQPATMAPLESPAPARPAERTGGVTVAAGQTKTVSAPPLNADSSLAQALYNSGAKSFSDGNYPDAVKIFTDFVNTYPSHKLTSNSYFWLGESFYMMKNYNSAISSYQKVIQDFPGSNKLQASMYKQGVAMFNSGKKDAAKIRLQDLVKKYPSSPEAQRAQKFMDKNLK